MKMCILKIWNLLILYVFFLSLTAQPQLRWQKNVAENEDVQLQSMIKCDEKSFYIAGKRGNDAYLLKINEEGEIIWQKDIDKGFNEKITSIQLAQNKEIIAVINPIKQKNSANINENAYILRFDSLGNEISAYKAYSKLYFGSPLQPYNEKEWLITFREEIIKDSIFDFGVAKLNEQGEIIWQKTYHADNMRFIFPYVHILPNKEFIFMALYQDSLRTKADNMPYWKKFKQNIYFIHCQADGKEISHQIFENESIISDLINTSDGNILISSIKEVKIANKDEDLDISLKKINPQTQALLWEKSVHLKNNDYASSISEINDNQYIVSAFCGSYLSDRTENTALVAFEQNGNIAWTKVFRDGNVISQILSSQAGQFITIGYYDEKYAQEMPKEKAKTSQSRILGLSANACIWEKSFLETENNKQPFSMTKDNKTGYWISGIDFQEEVNNNPLFIYHIDNEGNILWEQHAGIWNPSMNVPIMSCTSKENNCIVLNNKEEIYAFSEKGQMLWKQKPFKFKNIGAISPCKNGNEYVLSGFEWKNYPENDFWVGKIDENAKEIWQKNHTLSLPVKVWDMKKCADGGFIVGAEAGEVSKRQQELIKINEEGEIEWNQIYPSEGESKADTRAVIALKDNGFAIAGNIYNPSEKYRAHLIKTDAKGNKEWELSFIKTDNDVANVKIVQEEKGNIILAATNTHSIYKGDQEIYVAKITLEGKILWEKYIGGANTHELGGMEITEDNQILIVGQCKYEYHNDNSHIYLAKIKND